MQMLPSVPTLVSTALAVAPPAVKLRLLVSGRASPQGYTVANPARSGLTAVRLMDTARAVAGTPPRPLTCSVVVDPAATVPVPEYWPSIVLRASIRVVCNATTGNAATIAMVATPVMERNGEVSFMDVVLLAVGDEWRGAPCAAN